MSLHLPLLLSAALVAATPTLAQTPTTPPPPASDAAKADTQPANDQAAQERIMTLVRAGKCSAAKSEATRVGDLSLADQIGTMCGARSSDPFAKRGGGGGGGRRGGGGGGPGA